LFLLSFSEGIRILLALSQEPEAVSIRGLRLEMKQTIGPKATQTAKADENAGSRSTRQAVPPVGRLAQLSAMVNGSSRQQALAQLKDEIQDSPRGQSLMSPAGTNQGAPAQLSATPTNDDPGLEPVADVMGEKALTAPDTASKDEKKGPAKPRARAPVQRKVMVNNKPATMLSETNAFVDGKRVALDGRSAEWVTDGYARFYNTAEEFGKHAQGKPVDVGLAKKLGRWYRLPFFSEKRFFVLGENHGAFGYRELVQESNQSGKVLGEGGSNPLFSATGSSELQANPKGLKTESGGAREFMMENVAAKAYFGLTFLHDYCKKAEKGESSPPQPAKLPEKDWLEQYQSAPPEKRKTGAGLNRIPYFEDQSGKKTFATFGTKAENYNPLNTAFNVAQDLSNAIAAFKGEDTSKLKEIRGRIEAIRKLKDAETVDHGKIIKQIELLYPLLRNLAFREARKLNDNEDPKGDLLKRLKVAQENLPKSYTEEQQKSFAHRDYVMYKSVLKARESGDFIMAGIGDNHAKNLALDLAEAGIPLVRFSDFVGATYSADAIKPLKETEGFSEKVREAKAGKKKFLQAEKLRFLASLFFRLSRRISIPEPSASSSRELPLSLAPRLTPSMLNLFDQVAESPQYLKSETIEPLYFSKFAQIQQEGGSMVRSGDQSRPAQLDPSLLLARAREAVQGIFIVVSPPTGGSGQEIVVHKTAGPNAIPLTLVFDRFLELGRLVGTTIEFAPTTTLNEIFEQIEEQYRRKKAGPEGPRALALALPDSRIQQQAAELNAILSHTPLGETTIGSILKMVQGASRSEK
jgi:hypothetical protein